MSRIVGLLGGLSPNLSTLTVSPHCRRCSATRCVFATGTSYGNPRLSSSRYAAHQKRIPAQTQTERRFFGSSASKNFYDASPNWRDWFSAAEYENPWDASSSRLQPLDYAPADYATKHIIHLLQHFHHQLSSSGTSERFSNRVTTEQCNNALNNLLDLIPSQKEKNRLVRKDSDVARIQRITERANAILENMELVDDVVSSTLLHVELGNTVHPHDPVRLAFLPPKPNRETYNTVLQIFARTTGPREVPQRAAQIVERMEWRYAQRHELELKPVSFHWNCVLLAWAQCEDWEKPVHAMRLILDKAAQDPGWVDNSSYIHLLRMCALHHHHHHARPGDAEHASDGKAAKLGASVAVKLWQELLERGKDDTTNAILPVPADLPSHFYSHFLQAIRALDIGSPMRQRYYAIAFQQAVERGKINRFVLQEFFLHVRDPVTFDRFLGPYRQSVAGMTADDAVRTILKLVPSEWKCNAQVKGQSERDESSSDDEIPVPPTKTSA